MRQYYYVIACLPALQYDGENRMSGTAFMQLCRDFLEPDDYTILESCSYRKRVVAAGSSQAGLAWLAWERSLRIELARLRASKKGWDSEQYKQDSTDLMAIKAAAQAVAESSPLAAEEILLRTTWRFLEELEIGHFFDLDRIIIYYLKLQIMELRRERQRERGESEFDRLYATLSPGVSDQRGVQHDQH